MKRALWKRALCLSALCLSYATLNAHTVSNQPSVTHLAIGVDYLNVTMPGNQPKLGLTGLHLTHQFQNGLQFGGAVYAAVNGNYSGLFLLGPEFGYQITLAKHLGLYANAFAGTGGGHSLATQMGSGGTLILSAGAMLPFEKWSLGTGFSNLQVNGGHIHSNQWTVRLSMPLHLLLWDPLSNSSSDFYVSSHAMTMMPFAMMGMPEKAYDFSGNAFARKNALVGMELSQMLSKNWFYFLRASASFHGGYSGYMDISAGSGLRLPLGQSPLAVVMRVAVGTGGGGGVDLGGGLFVHPEAGLAMRLTPRLDLHLLGGYLSGFSGHYHLKTLLMGLGYRFNVFSPGDMPVNSAQTTVHRVNIYLGNETYINPQNPKNPNRPIQLVSVKLEGMLSSHWFASGESAFAYTGRIPGYATGLVGGGYRYQYHRTAIYAKLLAGAAGGGGIDVNGGLVVKPAIGVDIDVNKQLGVYAEVAKLKALRGSFAPITAEVGLAYHLNLLGD